MRIKAGDSIKSATPLTGLRLALAGLVICVAARFLTPLPITIAGLNRSLTSALLDNAAGLTASGSVNITSDGSTIFVVNPDSSSVSAIDARTDEKIGEVFVGADPQCLALSPDGQRLFITSQGASMLTVLDAGRLSILAAIRVGAEPYGIVIDPGGAIVYIASSATSSVEVIDMRLSDQWRYRSLVITRIPVGAKPKGLALAADGSRLYVTHFLSGEVSVIDTARREVIQVISTGADSNFAQKIAIHPTSGRA